MASWLRAVELALVTTSPTQPPCVAECRCRRPSAPGRGGPVGRSGGFCGSTSFVSAALGDRLVPCSWRRACMWLNSWVRPSPPRSRRRSHPAAQLTRATAVQCSRAAASRVASVWPVAVKRNWIWLVVEARPARLAWSRLHCDPTSKRHARGWRWFGSTEGSNHGRIFRAEPRPAFVNSGPEPHRQIRPGVGFC